MVLNIWAYSPKVGTRTLMCKRLGRVGLNVILREACVTLTPIMTLIVSVKATLLVVLGHRGRPPVMHDRWTTTKVSVAFPVPAF